jgi:hypothetical protein
MAMDEYTLGTSTVVCMYGRPVKMVVVRVLGELVWFRGLPIPFLSEEDMEVLSTLPKGGPW